MTNVSDISNKWFALFYRSINKFPNKTALNPTVSVEQSLTFSCGAAIITDILKTLNRKATESDILRKMSRTLQLHNIYPDRHGIPPFILLKTLKMYKVRFVENVYSSNCADYEARFRSVEALEAALLDKSICIAGIQTTPCYWVMHKRTKELLLKDDIPDDADPSEYALIRVVKKDYNPDRKPKPYIGHRKHGIGYACTSKSFSLNGHYIIVVGMLSDGARDYYITVDPAYHYFQRVSKSCELIDSSYYGYRLIEKSYFINKWYDEEYDGKRSFFWFVEVKM